jgi:fructose-1,6-bisphosphatase I
LTFTTFLGNRLSKFIAISKSKALTLSEHSIINPKLISADLFDPIDALCRVGRDLAHRIAKGPLGGSLGHEVGNNFDGDNQKALDVMADDAFATALAGTGVRWYASEEQDEVTEIDSDGHFALAIDPLDGSSNIDVNVSIGTIFSIFPATDQADASFLRPADQQIAAGYIIYGPQTALVVTFGDGVQNYVLDPETRSFVLVEPALVIPDTSVEFAINASNRRHWPKPIRGYIDECLAGVDGPQEKNFNMRWIASLVAEAHRIINRGGIFLYPQDARKGYGRGRLRTVYECAPIAMLIEQAGGVATDGQNRLLSRSADALHARTPFVFGTGEMVDRVRAFHNLPDD